MTEARITETSLGHACGVRRVFEGHLPRHDRMGIYLAAENIYDMNGLISDGSWELKQRNRLAPITNDNSRTIVEPG